MATVGRWAAAFGRFWWDFLVGDTPELFVAVLVVIGLALALHRQGGLGAAVVILAAVGFVSLSTWRGRRRRG